MKIFILYRWLFFLALIAITALAVIPQESVIIGTGWDKANHLIAFFVLLLLLDWAYPALSIYKNKFLLMLMYGVAIEIVQSFVPGRFASGLDVLADALGLVLYLAIRPFLIAYSPFITSGIAAVRASKRGK